MAIPYCLIFLLLPTTTATLFHPLEQNMVLAWIFETEQLS